MNSSCVNATNCQLSVNTSECNGHLAVGDLFKLNLMGYLLSSAQSTLITMVSALCILDSLGLTQCRALKFEFGTPYGL